jgi:hypothetical protein
MHWFQRLVITELKRRGWPNKRGALTDFSRSVGIEDHTTVLRWVNGSLPNITFVEQVLDRLGGDISRALPDAPPASTDEELREKLKKAEEDARQLRHTLASLSSHLSQLARAIAPEAPTARLLREVIRDGSAPEVPLPTVLVDAPEPPPPQPKPKKKGTR